jgi:CheY-like chemotaxis protein
MDAGPDRRIHGKLRERSRLELRTWEHVEGRISVPAIAVSAFCRDEDVRRSIAAGFDRHWTKPVEAAHIVDEIGAWIPASR